MVAAAIGPPAFKLETVVPFMCISFVVHRPVTHAIVALTEPEKYD